MASPSPEHMPDGVNFFVTWGLIEWAMTGMLSAGAAVGLWVWNLAQRIEKLENARAIDEREIDTMRKAIREVGNALDHKIDTETERLEERMERMTERLEELREDLPSRGFIEGQLNNLQARIDRSMDAKLAGR